MSAQGVGGPAVGMGELREPGGPVALIVNTAARHGRAFARARRLLREAGVPLAEAHELHDAARLPDVVDGAIARGARVIVIAGGDGTISSVATRLARAEAVLGVLPTGTANDLARTLGIPADLPAACRVVRNGRVVQVDLGTVGTGHFVNVASVGLSVAVTKALSPHLKRRLGPLAYPTALARAYHRHRPFDARLSFPDGDHGPVELAGLLQVAVANGRFYGGGAAVSPTARIDDHLLDVYAIPTGTAWQRAVVARHFLSGAFTERDHVLHLTTRRVRLETDPPLPVNVDGEIVARTPEDFGVLQGGLGVLVPPDVTPAGLAGAGFPGPTPGGQNPA